MKSLHKQHLSLRSHFKGPPVHMSRKKHRSREIGWFSKGLGFANTPIIYLVLPGEYRLTVLPVTESCNFLPTSVIFHRKTPS